MENTELFFVDLLHPLTIVCQTATHNHLMISVKCLASLNRAHNTQFCYVSVILLESVSQCFQCGLTQQNELLTYPLHMHGAYSTLSFCMTICTVLEMHL